jgi:hypothetical protein
LLAKRTTPVTLSRLETAMAIYTEVACILIHLINRKSRNIY